MNSAGGIRSHWGNASASGEFERSGASGGLVVAVGVGAGGGVGGDEWAMGGGIGAPGNGGNAAIAAATSAFDGAGAGG